MDSATMIVFATLLLETAKSLANNGVSTTEVIDLATKAVEIFDKAVQAQTSKTGSAKCVVQLQSFGERKIDCIKVVRTFNPQMGLKEAKELVESAPCVVLKTDDIEQARNMWSEFYAIGAFDKYTDKEIYRPEAQVIYT